DADGVRVRKRVEVPGDLADEFSVAIEFEQLRGRGAERGTDCAAARERKYMSLRIHGDAGNLTEGQVIGQLKKGRIAVVGNFRHRGLLRKRARKNACDDDRPHSAPPGPLTLQAPSPKPWAQSPALTTDSPVKIAHANWQRANH